MRPSWNSFQLNFDQTEKDRRRVVSTRTVATKDEVASAVEKALKPGRFFLAPGCRLRVRHEPREEIPWELFAGHLLDETKTRLRKSFESWNIHFDDSVAPVISVRYDQPEGRIHVTRNILTHVWAPYGEQRQVIQTRETRRWLPELIGTIELSLIADRFDLQQQISRLVLLAVVGTSRLPTTSWQSPLPQFSLGQLGYFPALDSSNVDDILSDPMELLGPATEASVSSLERARLLEMSLRACEKVSSLATRDIVRRALARGRFGSRTCTIDRKDPLQSHRALAVHRFCGPADTNAASLVEARPDRARAGNRHVELYAPPSSQASHGL